MTSKGSLRERKAYPQQIKRLKYDGKKVKDFHTVGYYNIKKEHTLQMTGRLRGGGKRGASTSVRGRKADVSKDDVIDEMVLKLQRTFRSLVNCQIPALVTTLNHISQMKDSCEADNMYGLSLIGTFTTPQLQNLNLAAGSGNKDYKVNMVKSYVFPI